MAHRNQVPRFGAYTKEDLPTWNEFYTWYQSKETKLRSQDQVEPYWNIPHQLYTIAVVCNQLNKLLFVDGNQHYVLKTINETLIPGAMDLRFCIHPFAPDGDWNEMMCERNVGLNSKVPIIYTIPLPNGQPNPFIVRDDPRIDVTTIRDSELYLILEAETEDGTCIYILDGSEETFWKIVEIIMKPVLLYYQDPIGWKD